MVDQCDWVDREAFPFEARFVETSFGRVHYVDEGARDGEVVVLVHGTPSWSFEFRHLIPLLARGRRVIAVDHLGFGLSERPERFDYSPEAHTAVLREVVARLGLVRFSLVVHDYGGHIALPLAVAEPERISRLVVLNSWMWHLAEDPQVAQGARLLGSWLGRFLYRWLNASLRLLMPFGFAVRSRLTPQIHGQYLAPFRWGRGDRALPVSALERFRQALPQASVQELAGVGHWPQEEAPEEVARLLDGFLPRAPLSQAMLASA